MERNHKIITGLVILTITLITVIGCTAYTQPPTPHLPQPETHIISPYNLDEEGYYIADVETGWYGRAKGHNEQFKQVEEYNTTPNFTPHSGNPHFNVTLIKNNITSGEALVFEGTSTMPPNTFIAIDIGDFHTPHQYYSAPILPGVNGTNIIKVKIPAFNIRINKWDHHDRTFPQGDTYENIGYFGLDGFNFTITSDTNYPMIWEDTSYFPSLNTYVPPHIWVWTNDTSIEHQFKPDDPFFANNVILPYPTYKPPQKW